jgi:hypothetical protein
VLRHAEDQKPIVFVAGSSDKWPQEFKPFRRYFDTLRFHKMVTFLCSEFEARHFRKNLKRLHLGVWTWQCRWIDLSEADVKANGPIAR